MDQRRQPIGDDCTVEQVADLLDEVYAANGLLADEMDRILGSRAASARAPSTGSPASPTSCGPVHKPELSSPVSTLPGCSPAQSSGWRATENGQPTPHPAEPHRAGRARQRHEIP